MTDAPLFSWIKSLLRAPANAPAAPRQLIVNQMPDAVYAVGDVHGCLDLYAALEKQIAAKVNQSGGNGLLIVLGDFVDRGPNAAQMIDHLLAPPPPHVTRIALMGNHEEMFLKFLNDPSADHPWLAYGGRETLHSYGIMRDGLDAPRGAKLRQILDASVPSEHRAFLKNLPHAVHLPRYLFSHAGANPARSARGQTAQDLMWGDPALLDGAPLNIKVVHGHTPTTDAKGFSNHARVNVDTGAYATGVLTAVELTNAGPDRFLVAHKPQIT